MSRFAGSGSCYNHPTDAAVGVGPLSEEIEFNAEEFLRLPLEERIRLCRRLAEHAQALGEQASPKYRDYYAEIAKQWQILADEMQQAVG
jgi:hypothetical protein